MESDQIIIRQFVRNHPEQLTIVLKDLSKSDIVPFLKDEPLDLSSHILASLSSYKAAQCLEDLNVKRALDILHTIDKVQKRSILRHVDEEFRNLLLETMPPEQSSKVKQYLTFDEESIGYFMTPLNFVLKQSFTVEEALNIARAEKQQSLSSIAVIDSNGKIEGLLNLHNLLVADGSVQIATIMDRDFPKFFADNPIQSIEGHEGWIQYHSIPVTDRLNTLIGSLDYSTLIGKKIPESAQKETLLAAGNALGELYRVGMLGLINGIGK